MYDPKDARGVPVSAGIPKIVIYAAILGFVVIIYMLGIVIGTSAYGHVWPSLDSTRIKLG